MYISLASEYDLPVNEVARCVESFFGAIAKEAKALPFNDERRIYAHDIFDEYAVVTCIPYIGRLGTSYSRYLLWRSNESKKLGQVNRNAYRDKLSQDEIETIAETILSGGVPVFPSGKRGKEPYDRVWMVGRRGKKMARQVIPKKKQ